MKSDLVVRSTTAEKPVLVCIEILLKTVVSQLLLASFVKSSDLVVRGSYGSDASLDLRRNILLATFTLEFFAVAFAEANLYGAFCDLAPSD